jgi:hypothetical protein
MADDGDPQQDPSGSSRREREDVLRRLAEGMGATPPSSPSSSAPTERATQPANAAARPSVWRLSLSAGVAARRRRGRLLALVSAALLAAVVVGALALHSLAGVSLPGLAGALALPPGAINRVYLDSDVPWAVVTLDGRAITPPIIGQQAPLTLAPGTHQIRWTAAPFDAQSCQLSIPASRNDTCQLSTNQIVTLPHQPTAQLVYLEESLATLSTTQQAALKQAIQAALANYTAQAQPGEPYINLRTVANEPLRVTLGEPLYADASGSPADGCFFPLDTYSGGCALDGRNCVQICTLPWSSRAQLSTPDPHAWYALALSALTWSIHTLSGRSLISDQPVSQNAPSQPPVDPDPILLRITWTGTRWSAQQVAGSLLPRQLVLNDDGTPIPDDPACFDAYASVEGAANPYAPFNHLAYYSQVRFISGPNPAVGCLVEATAGTPGKPPAKGASVARYLDRFGVVYALNSVDVPALFEYASDTSAIQQQVAQSLSAYPGQTFMMPADVGKTGL